VAAVADLHDVTVVQQPVEHRRRQRLVVGEGRGPPREGRVACQHHGRALVALGHHVEEQLGFLAALRLLPGDLLDVEACARARAGFAQPRPGPGYRLPGRGCALSFP